MKFSPDNVVFRALGKLADCVCLSIIWCVCCVPFITFGAAASALYYTVHKCIRRDQGYIVKSFFTSFRRNFKQATLSWLAVLALLVLFVLDAALLYTPLMDKAPIGWLFYVFPVAILCIVGWCCVLFPYIARFENTVRISLKNTLLLAVIHLPWTLLLLLILLLGLFLTGLYPPCLFFFPVGIVWLYDVILERIFRRYMSREDLEKETENEETDKQERV